MPLDFSLASLYFLMIGLLYVPVVSALGLQLCVCLTATNSADVSYRYDGLGHVLLLAAHHDVCNLVNLPPLSPWGSTQQVSCLPPTGLFCKRRYWLRVMVNAVIPVRSIAITLVTLQFFWLCYDQLMICHAVILTLGFDPN